MALSSIDVGDVRVGDLVFCARPGALQSLCDRAAGGWRHVGIVADVPTSSSSERSLIEIGGDLVQARPLDVVAGAYERVGVARLSEVHRGCAAAASREAVTWVGEPFRYAWDHTIAAGFVSWARQSKGPVRRGWADRAAGHIRVQELALRDRGLRSMTCSSFIVEVFRRSSSCDLEFEPARRSVPVEPVRVLRTNGVTRIDRRQVGRLARAAMASPVELRSAPTAASLPDALITPGDIWNAPFVVSRWHLSDRRADGHAAWWG